MDERTASRRRVGKVAAERAEARLMVVYPPACVSVVPVREPGLVVGRKPGAAGVELSDATLSRAHFALEWDGDSWIGKDLESRNGSWMNGAEVEGRVVVPMGAVLRLGDVLAVLDGPADAAAARDVSRDAVPGESSAVHALRAQLQRAGGDPSAALIIGETGAGKESIAAELHRLSKRKGAFIAANCAAFSPQIIESQLFGHLKGAFTGADQPHDGLFRSAHRGTLFLDEIGEMPLEQQPRLLRAIQEREVHPLGGTKPVPVDVRVVAATNRDLYAEVEKGTFRRDLYARLSMWELKVPALRERRADVLAWLSRLHAAWKAERGDASPVALELEPDAAEALLLAAHPLNLRGLEKLVHELATVRGAVTKKALPRWLDASATKRDSGEAAVKVPVPTREELAAVLERTHSIRATAKHFGRDRRQVYRWLKSFGLTAPAGDE